MAIAIAGSAAVAGAAISSNASSNAAKSSSNAAKNASATQLQMYNQTREDLQPYAQQGVNATNQINALNSGDYTSFTASPDYQFTLNQGIAGLDKSAAARGVLNSTGYGKDLLNYASGVASQQYNNYYNKIAGQQSLGQSAAAGTAAAGQNYANASAANTLAAGQANAANAINQGNIANNTINQFASAYGQYGTGSAYGKFSAA